LEEIARIWRLSGNGEASIIITKEDLQHYWGRATERTASSFSERQGGHYASVFHSDLLSEVHFMHLGLITKTGASPKRESKGPLVMLEKIAGVAVVIRLCVIFLVEAEVSCHNRRIISDRIMKLACDTELVPEGSYSKDTILYQVLVYGITRKL
jgi:hypothetical protein